MRLEILEVRVKKLAFWGDAVLGQMRVCSTIGGVRLIDTPPVPQSTSRAS